MNHLGVDGVGRVIFDSSDVAMVEDEDENNENDQDPRIDISELQCGCQYNSVFQLTAQYSKIHAIYHGTRQQGDLSFFVDIQILS